MIVITVRKNKYPQSCLQIIASNSKGRSNGSKNIIHNTCFCFLRATKPKLISEYNREVPKWGYQFRICCNYVTTSGFMFLMLQTISILDILDSTIIRFFETSVFILRPHIFLRKKTNKQQQLLFIRKKHFKM